MKKLFAVPTINQKLCAHFGHSEQFAVVATEDQKIISVEYFSPPVHQPGTYPKFLAGKGVSTIISGGMGQKAQDVFAHHNIEVYMGIDSEIPELLVEKYLGDQLQAGDNQCDQ